MKRLPLLLLAVLSLFVWSCTDQATQPAQPDFPDGLEPQLDLVDAENGEGGNDKFYWLFPLTKKWRFDGKADRDLYPTVEVCPLAEDGSGCDPEATPLVIFARADDGRPRGWSQGDDEEEGVDSSLRVDSRGHYRVLWNMQRHRPEREGKYRIRVLLKGFELGYADVITLRVRDIFGYLRTSDGELVPIADRGVFPIGFRIEEGALDSAYCDPDGDGDFQDCDTGVEDPTDGEATTVTVTAETSDGTVVAAVITAPDGVFVDEQGVPIPDVILTAEVELTPPSEDILTDNDQELPFFVEVNTIPGDVFLTEEGVSVVICQNEDELDARGIVEAVHPQLILYKVSDPKPGFPDGETKRLPTVFGAPECEGFAPAPAPEGFAASLKQGAKRLFRALGPEPVRARRLHGGLNTVIRRDVSLSDEAFSTFGSTLGPNAAASFAVVPDGQLGEPTQILIQVRNALEEDLAFGGDDLSALVTDGPNAGTQATVVDNGNGIYSAEYTPVAAGTDVITITLTTADGWSQGEIGGSPYSSTIPSAASPATSTVTTSSAMVGAPVTITVQARDGSGDPLSTSGDDVSVTVTLSSPPPVAVSGPSMADGPTLVLEVTDNGDGTYTAVYVPSAFGRDFIQVTIDGVPLDVGLLEVAVSSAIVQWGAGAGGNDHWYQVILTDVAEPLTWTEARDEAAARSHMGLPGHLVTILESDENDFLVASFPTTETYWQGLSGAGGVMAAVTGETVFDGLTAGCVVAFCNWAAGEPINFTNGALLPASDNLAWTTQDDDAAGAVRGYLVEYEDPPGE